MARLSSYIPAGVPEGIDADIWRVERAVANMSLATTRMAMAGYGTPGVQTTAAQYSRPVEGRGINANITMDRVIVGRMVADEVSRVLGTEIEARR